MVFQTLKLHKKMLPIIILLVILGIIWNLKTEFKWSKFNLSELVADNMERIRLASHSLIEERGTGDQNYIAYRRILAAELLKVKEDIRRGRKNLAITKLRVIAGLLDKRYYDSTTPYPVDQPGWVPETLPSTEKMSQRKNNNTVSTSVNSVNMTSADINHTSSQNEGNNALLPNIDAESISILGSSITLGSIVTILIDECHDPPIEGRKTKMERIVSQIRQHWPYVKIVIGVARENLTDLDDVQNGNDVIAIGVKCDPWNHAPMEPFFPYVKSPYVLFLDSTAAVTSDLNITRLLRVSARLPGVGVVGISERGVDGGWDYRCSQLQHRNAHLTITDGYEYSQAACLFCDVTSPSFLAATNVLLKVMPDSTFPMPIRQIDWALRLHNVDVMTVTCPDVMIHTTNEVVKIEKSVSETDHPCTTKEEKREARDHHLALKKLYRKLAQKYELSSISFHNRTFLEYTCQEIYFECKARSRVQEFLLPPCCLKLKNNLLKNYHAFAKDNLIPYRIDAGTLLGAVKFKNPIPWDFDEDIDYEDKYTEIFKQNIVRLIQMGFAPSFTSYTGNTNYVYMFGKGNFRFELWGREELPDELSKVENKTYPINIPCLQYGYYPIRIQNFLKDSSNITNKIKTLRKEENELRKNKKVETPKNYQSALTLLPPGTSPPIQKVTCYLYSFVRLGDNWSPAPFNPGLHALRRFGDGLYKHQPHWRFVVGSPHTWPPCSSPGNPMCLDIHPMDGTIPFT